MAAPLEYPPSSTAGIASQFQNLSVNGPPMPQWQSSIAYQNGVTTPAAVQYQPQQAYIYSASATASPPVPQFSNGANVNMQQPAGGYYGYTPSFSSPPPTVPQFQPQYQKIVPESHQLDHNKRLLEILSKTYGYVDVSMMRLGKTFSSSYIAQLIGFAAIYVVCPTTVKTVWEGMKTKYGLPIANIITYESLRSTRGHTPKHGLLERRDYQDEKGEWHVEFEASAMLKHVCADPRGAFFIFDESQRIKNKNDQWYAAMAITSHIITTGGMSRFAFLSGTPIDKEEHAIHMMQIMSIIRAKKLFIYHKDIGELQLIGAQELVNYCKELDPQKTAETLARYPFTQKTVHQTCYRLFLAVVYPNISSEMSPRLEEAGEAVKVDSVNYYANMPEAEAEAYAAAVDDLGRAARYNESTGTRDVRGDSNFGAITTALKMINMTGAAIFIRKAIELLEAYPTSKVVIATIFSGEKPGEEGAFDYWEKYLRQYGVLKVNGKVTGDKRTAAIARFNNRDLSCRVMLCNMKLLSQGISLEDVDGDRQRFALVEPNYYVSDMHQFKFRFDRGPSTKSKTKMMIMYGKCAKKLVGILNALVRKSDIMKDTLVKQVEAGVMFPGDYPQEIEPDLPGMAIMPAETARIGTPGNRTDQRYTVQGLQNQELAIFSNDLRDENDPDLQSAIQASMAVSSPSPLVPSSLLSGSNGPSSPLVPNSHPLSRNRNSAVAPAPASAATVSAIPSFMMPDFLPQPATGQIPLPSISALPTIPNFTVSSPQIQRPASLAPFAGVGPSLFPVSPQTRQIAPPYKSDDGVLPLPTGPPLVNPNFVVPQQ